MTARDHPVPQERDYRIRTLLHKAVSITTQAMT